MTDNHLMTTPVDSNAENWEILLVDDEPDNLEVVAESLEFFGATVRTACNGRLALDTMKDWKPTFILLDLSMPVMDGWETLRQIRHDPRLKDLPVLALTAHAIAGDSERALAVGFNGYLTKPLNIPTLMQDLHKALNEAVST